MNGEETESCGRCAMSTATALFDDPPDPYEGARIEVDEGQMRAVSPAAWLSGVTSRLDAWAEKVTYGR